jgi:hypothetical protein
MLTLPRQVRSCLESGVAPELARWRLGDTDRDSLLEALGRSLASTDSAGFVSKKRLAFARGDEIHYPSTGAAADSLVADNTAIVQRLERTDPFFQKLVADQCQRCGRRVSISAYIADVHSRAFSWHVDKWDNIVVQLQGRKAFDLDTDATQELCPGDAFFLPEDVRHRTRTLERSVHLSVAYFPRDGSTH